MNINRLLSRREKDVSSHRRQKSRDKSSDKKTRPISSDGIISLFKYEPQRNLDKEQNAKIQKIKQRLHDAGYVNIGDEQVNYGLFSKHANGDVDKAVELLVLFQESVEGVIKPYNPSVHMWGAENREGVTCYLDALLFAMFARLGSFEPILYTIYDDEPRRRLSTLIRLWVNMLRTGMLIQTDVTGYLQKALSECGWEEAGKLKQQDTSEAFSFITEKLQLPLLTLKMDIYHTGAEDAKDDHKLVHERLLEVAVPPDPGNGRPVQLEDCLESYFNNRVEVVRHLERSNTLSSVLERSNTSASVRSAQSYSTEKGGASHVEVSELSWSTPDTPTSLHAPETPLTPSGGRNRATSIIRHRLVQDNETGETSKESDIMSRHNSVRKGSIRKEVLMPAWQFFNLIPWYTKSSITSDASVAAHFSQTRPVLGICLKRYAMSPEGRAIRQNTFIDIPLEIGLPHFIQDDMIEEEGPLMGNFKLSLQSVICHRGNSVHSGHYISFIRGTTQIADGDCASDRRLSNINHPPHYPVDRWIRHDDLAKPRVSYVDIEQALKDEMPYLLFYQVQPTYDESPSPGLEGAPPSYDSGINMTVTDSSPQVDRNPYHAPLQQGYFDVEKEEPTLANRFSSEIERPRQSLNLPEERRGSLPLTEASIASAASSMRGPEVISAPVTPNEETTAQRLSRAASRFRKSGSKSRPTSSSGENRISATFSRMALRSKEQLNKMEASKDSILIPNTDGITDPPDPVVVVKEDVAIKPVSGAPSRKVSKTGRKHDKNKGFSEKDESNHHHHHHHVRKGRATDVPDRECTIM